MKEYLDLIEAVLNNGGYKPNRTGVDTVASPVPQHYQVDVGDEFPLLTTKKMDGYRWDSLIHEFVWYMSGQHHIRDFREKSKIWNAWADDEYNLPTAYGRFWRRYPIPEQTDQLPGEWWADEDPAWMDDAIERFDTTEDKISEVLARWITAEPTPSDSAITRTLNRFLPWKKPDTRDVFDQIQYIIDTLNGENPMRGANSRRLMVTPWNPANAAVSHLPPCHAFWGVNVQGDKLNLHLTQRSGDIALGIPFNIAAYSLILKVLAAQTDFEPGVFSHTIIDAHIYAGKGKRGEWYADNIEELKARVSNVDTKDEFGEVREWIERNAPAEAEGADGFDHVPGLLTQLTRTPKEHPTVEIADKPLDDLEYEDIQLRDYESDSGLNFSVAE